MGARTADAPTSVLLTFTEPVQLLRPSDASVVASDGTVVSDDAAIRADDARVLELPLQSTLSDDTYTVRFQIIGADSHVIPGVFVFGVGVRELGEPYLSEAGDAGPSETGGWGVSARMVELLGLGGLFGLLAFRWLVWAPTIRRSAHRLGAETQDVLGWGRDTFWTGFGLLALGAMLAQGYLLVVQSAGALGVGVLAALQDTAGIGQVLGETRFGELVQLRGVLLFCVLALGSALFLREAGGADALRPARASFGPLAAATLALLLLGVMAAVAAQGHPAVAPLPALQITAQVLHLGTVSVWLTGLAVVILALARLPRIAPDSGAALAAMLLARYSRVGLMVVAIAVITGVLRSVSELGGPQELWETSYGRSILYKLLLLVPIAALALYNRRMTASLQGVTRPNRASLTLVRRAAAAEFLLALAVVGVASILVAQVPGGA